MNEVFILAICSFGEDKLAAGKKQLVAGALDWGTFTSAQR